MVARHAESVFNVRGVLNGNPAVPGPLTRKGKQQARRLGRDLANEPVDLCVTTDFPRTQQTADLALDGRDIPRLVLPLLNEVRG